MTKTEFHGDEDDSDRGAQMTPRPNLASNLVGKTINAWVVEKKISKQGGTGGAFSSGYAIRRKDGRRNKLDGLKPSSLKRFRLCAEGALNGESVLL
jgi:hypothetical protein